MKKVFINEYLQNSVKDLVNLRNDLKKQLFDHRIKNALRGLKETHFINVLRRNIARVNTALSYKLKGNGDNMK